jgi:hypothetical protein
MRDLKHDCYGCGATEGQVHDEDCDHAQCALSGEQYIQCDEREHPDEECRPTTWAGSGSEELACEEYGWYAIFVPREGFMPCEPTAEGAECDLNRVRLACDWDRQAQRWVRRTDS